MTQEPNVARFLRDAAQRRPERPALCSDAEVVTFGTLWERVCRVSEGLRGEGLEPGQRVIVMVPMSVDLYVVLLAILKMGAIAVFCDPWIGVRQIAAFCGFAEPAAFVGIPRSHLLRLLEPRLRGISITVTTRARFLSLPARRTLRELHHEADQRLSPVSPDDAALITFTTGSSGSPKGANRTHGFLAAQHEALRAAFPALDDDVDMSMFPVFALNNLALGITSVIPSMDFRHVDRVDPRAILAQMARFGVTTATASPPFFDRLTGARDGARPQLRRALTGGAPVSDRQLRAWQEAMPGTEIVVAYGSTEAEPVAHMSVAERLQVARGARAAGYCAGRPISRLHSRILRIHRGPVKLTDGWRGWEQPQGEIGELVVSGPHVCRGYYRSPEADAENKIVGPEGEIWHRMGDTGYFDREGRFWLVGRVHSTIARRGEWLHPQLLEQAAREAHPGILQVAAVGVPDPALGERAVIVVHAPGAPDAPEAVRRSLVLQRLVFDDVILRHQPLPVDPRHNSKIQYDRLREELQL